MTNGLSKKDRRAIELIFGFSRRLLVAHLFLSTLINGEGQISLLELSTRSPRLEVERS
jgi:hypothetical protein